MVTATEPVVVKIPGSNDSFQSFSAELASLPYTGEVHFDFADVGFSTPGWMISIGAALRQFKLDRPDVNRRKVLNFRHLGYAAHSGFFQFFGMDFGRQVAAASSSERFIPITDLLVDDIKSEAIEQVEHHGDTIQRTSERLIGVLLQARDTPAYQALSYAMREMIRNVVEHSASTDVTYAAQYWPGTGQAEIAIMDRGIGLANSLASNPKIGRVDDSQALDLAVQAGVSSKTWRRQRSDGVWSNSGYGLYMVKGLCLASGGSFSMISGSNARKWTKKGTTTFASRVTGTTVILHLNSDNLADIDSELARLRGVAVGKKPSRASMSLNPTRE